MPKSRINLSLERETYEAARDLLAVVPGTPSVSDLVNELLADFVAKIGPVVQRAKAGDHAAAFALLQKQAARDYAQVASDLLDLVENVHTNSAEGGTTTGNG